MSRCSRWKANFSGLRSPRTAQRCSHSAFPIAQANAPTSCSAFRRSTDIAPVRRFSARQSGASRIALRTVVSRSTAATIRSRVMTVRTPCTAAHSASIKRSGTSLRTRPQQSAYVTSVRQAIRDFPAASSSTSRTRSTQTRCVWSTRRRPTRRPSSISRITATSTSKARLRATSMRTSCRSMHKPTPQLTRCRFHWAKYAAS